MKIVLSLVLLLSQVAVIAQNRIEYKLIFDEKQKELSEDQKRTIWNLKKMLKADESAIMLPVSTNDDQYNATLSIVMSNAQFRKRPKFWFGKNAEKQAEAIKIYAESIGLTCTRIDKGFRTPYEGESIGTVLKYTPPPVTKEKQSKIVLLKDKYPEKPSQFFTIDPTRDTIIVGAEGTLLSFEAGALLSKEPTQVELKEYYDFQDYLKSGLTTVSNGKTLTTGGTIYLDATLKDQPKTKVQINQDKGVGIDFTIGKTDPDMEVYILDERSSTTNWVRSNQYKTRWKLTERERKNGVVVKEKVTHFNTKNQMDAYIAAEKEKRAQAKLAAQKAREARLEAQRLRELERQKEWERRNKLSSKLRTYDLGYINCDRFPNEPLIAMQFNTNFKEQAEYFLVIHSVRGVLSGYKENKAVKFRQVPKGQDATFMAVQFTDDGAMFYKQTLTTGADKFPEFELKSVSEDYVTQQLAQLKQ